MIALAAFASACATTPDVQLAEATQAGAETCRDILIPGTSTTRNVCGTSDQWSEYERRSEALTTGLVCREQLRTASNTIVTYCGTHDEWRRFRRAEALKGEIETLRIQGSAYNSGTF
jgi:hypothetical protein